MGRITLVQPFLRRLSRCGQRVALILGSVGLVWLGVVECGRVAAQTDRGFRPQRVLPAQRPIVGAPVLPADQVRGPVADNELVLGVVVQGDARAYPINMLVGPQREIINDTLGGTAIAATW